MPMIAYSMSGEGRGHATRVRAIVEDLRCRHRVVLFAPGQAYELLAPLYERMDVEVRRIEGLKFRYARGGTLDYGATLAGAAGFLLRLPERVAQLRDQLRAIGPDLAIVDFEPLLPRAAEAEGIPYVSIDHQHFLTEFSSCDLPAIDRVRCALMGMAVRFFHGRQRLTVVSSFYRPALRRGPWRRRVRQVGPLLGQDVLARSPSDDGFLLVYLRRDTPDRVFRALAECGLPARVYGTGRRGTDGTLSFHPVERESFVRDLARCTALVSTAGNQVVGEAIHLRKPVLALPESGNWEQGVNGFWVERLGIGLVRDPRDLRPGDIRGFLDRLDGFRLNLGLEAAGSSGNADVARLVEEAVADALRAGRASRPESDVVGRAVLGRAA